MRPIRRDTGRLGTSRRTRIHGAEVSVTLTSVSTRLANTPWANTVKIRDAQTGKATLTLNGAFVHGLAFSPSGHSLFINEDGTVNTYDGTPLPEKP